MNQPVVVTGGGGFLGTSICKKLIEAGFSVRSFSRKSYAHLTQLGVECVRGDISNYLDVKSALDGAQAVIHVAAKAGIWGAYQEFYKSNVVGTENILRACQQCQIDRLVYTSSPSVVFSGRDIEGADESSCSYPKKFLCAYPQTKMLAEKKVLATNGKRGLATVALRPHLIWGINDPHFLPRLIEKAKSGQLKKVGSLTNKVDVIWVENAADAHIQALLRLSSNSQIAGKAYFLGQDEPVNLWAFIDHLLDCCGLEPVDKRISFHTAFAIGSICESLFRFLSPSKEPPMTRFLALQLAKSHYFSHRQAVLDLGYAPQVSVGEGLAKLRKHLHLSH